MTKQELIDMLEGFDDDTEIRLITQPSYPLLYKLSHEIASNEECNIVYLFEGSSEGYPSRDILKQVGWR